MMRVVYFIGFVFVIGETPLEVNAKLAKII